MSQAFPFSQNFLFFYFTVLKKEWKSYVFYKYPILNLFEPHQVLVYILQVLHFTN
jgi:hypothetical protein